MSHNATEIRNALEFRFATPDVRGFEEHCQRLGLQSAKRCVELAMDDVILHFQRKEQSYYERKMIELRDNLAGKIVSEIEIKMAALHDEDIEGHIWWNKFKDFINVTQLAK